MFVIWLSGGLRRVKSFTLNMGWQLIRQHANRVGWVNCLWFNGHIPKHTLTLWRCLHDGLPTADQLVTRKIRVNHSCSFCWAGMDSRNHLFFECPFTFGIWRVILGLCFPTHRILPTIDREAVWVAKEFSGVGNMGSIGKLAFGATVHHICKEWNARLFQNRARTRDLVINSIKADVTDRCKSMTFTGQRTSRNSFLASSWDIEFSSTL